jgi:hypothetical protein
MTPELLSILALDSRLATLGVPPGDPRRGTLARVAVALAPGLWLWLLIQGTAVVGSGTIGCSVAVRSF